MGNICCYFWILRHTKKHIFIIECGELDMSMISSKDIETLNHNNAGQVETVKPVERIDPMQARAFSNLVDNENENKLVENLEQDGEITPEQLQRQIRENLFENGFNKAIDKAREIAKELREG